MWTARMRAPEEWRGKDDVVEGLGKSHSKAEQSLRFSCPAAPAEATMASGRGGMGSKDYGVLASVDVVCAVNLC